MPNKKSNRFFGLVLRGIGMGAADVIPGVSGGTIAFITGIYEELLETISGINFGLIKTWRSEGFKAMWKAANFSFLFSLLFGIAISIVSLVQVVTYLQETFPIHLWAFFFGLILASIWLVGKTVDKWNFATITGLIAGSLIAFFIATGVPVQDSSNLLYIFFCGSLAICAMILPGISGAFILILLGAYFTVTGSLSDLMHGLKDGAWDVVLSNGKLVAVFMIGCLAGLISFSKLLNWLFKKAKAVIISILTGFLIGSLFKIWPWKEVLETRIKHAGEPNEKIIPTLEKNVLPSDYDGEAFLWQALLLALFGLVSILILEYVGAKKRQKK